MNFYEAVMERRSGEDRRRIDRELDEAVDRRSGMEGIKQAAPAAVGPREVEPILAEDQLEVLTGSTRR